MTEDDLKAASDRLAAEYLAATENTKMARKAEDNANSAWIEAQRARQSAVNAADSAKLRFDTAAHIADGKCAAKVKSGTGFYAKWERCEKPAKAECSVCGGPFCGTHARELKYGGKNHNCQDWRLIVQHVLCIPEKASV